MRCTARFYPPKNKKNRPHVPESRISFSLSVKVCSDGMASRVVCSSPDLLARARSTGLDAWATLLNERRADELRNTAWRGSVSKLVVKTAVYLRRRLNPVFIRRGRPRGRDLKSYGTKKGGLAILIKYSTQHDPSSIGSVGGRCAAPKAEEGPVLLWRAGVVCCDGVHAPFGSDQGDLPQQLFCFVLLTRGICFSAGASANERVGGGPGAPTGHVSCWVRRRADRGRFQAVFGLIW